MAQDLAREFVADLYRRERSGIARSVSRISGESHAEDLVHDAFVAYLVKSPWATKPGAWIATVARNRALNELRRPKLVPLSGGLDGESEGYERTIPAENAEPSEDSEREAVRSVVAGALSALNERSLTAIRMKFFEGADYDVIADHLGVRVAQAHVIVHRALRRLGRELIHRMAAAHGVSSCAPALARLAGLGGGDDSHEGAPCPACRPAWDEICALRIGAWVPLPLVAFKFKVRGLLDRVAGRVTVREPMIAEPASRAATAFVAMGVAASSLTPALAATPSAVQRPAPVVAPAVAEGVPGANEAATVATGTNAANTKKAAPKNAPAPRSVPVAPGTRINQPEQDHQPTQVGDDRVGGVVVCPNVTTGCDDDPEGP